MNDIEKIAEDTEIALVKALKKYRELFRKELVEKAHSILKNSDKTSYSKKSIDNRIRKLEKRNVILSEKSGRKAFKSLNPKKELNIKPLTLEPIEEKPSDKIDAPSELVYKVKKEHSKELKPELVRLKKKIEETDVRIRPKGGLRLMSQYEPGREWAFEHLNEHVPELMEDWRRFREKLKQQHVKNHSFSKIITDIADVEAIKSCVSSAEEREKIGRLKECLEKRGINTHKWIVSFEKSSGRLKRVFVNSFEEGLKKLVNITEELQKERDRLIKELEDYSSRSVLPRICNIEKEQLET